MKFKKPSKTTLIDQAATLGGGLIGATASNGVFGLVHKPSGSVDPAVIKKEENMALIKRGGMAVFGGVLGASVDGNDTVSKVLKGVFLGVAIAQTIEVAKSFAAKSTAIKTGAAAVTTGQKFIANSLGLGCPCDTQTIGMGKPRRRASLRMPVLENYQAPVYQAVPMNDLERAMDMGAMAN